MVIIARGVQGACPARRPAAALRPGAATGPIIVDQGDTDTTQPFRWPNLVNMNLVHMAVGADIVILLGPGRGWVPAPGLS